MSEPDLARFLVNMIGEHWEWLLGFLTILLLIGLSWIRGLLRRRSTSNKTQENSSDSVRHLFWQLDCYIDGQDQEPRKVFLRSLTPNKATLLVTDTALQKGTSLKIDLSPILDNLEPGADCLVNARISRCTSVGGSPESYLIKVQFTSGRSWAPSAIQRYMNESIHRLQGKSQQLEVL